MMLRQKMSGSLLVLVACLFLSMPATAKAAVVDVTVGGGWYEVDLQPGSLNWKDQFSFNLLTPGILTVTDARLAGERFEVFSNGVSLGVTPEPLTNPAFNYTEDYDHAANDPIWSTGVWNLAAGNYLISGELTRIVFGTSNPVGALRIDSAPVPAPAAVWLLGSALVGGLGLRRFRKN